MSNPPLNPQEQEIDDLYLAESRFLLAAQMREHVVEWSRQFGDRFLLATYSAVNGRWDDVKKDLQQGRISLEESTRLVNKMLEVRLISSVQHNWYLGQFQAIGKAEAGPGSGG